MATDPDVIAWRRDRRNELLEEHPFCVWCGDMVTKPYGPLTHHGNGYYAHEKRLKLFRPTCATLEHMVPQSKGGEDTEENTRLACWKCNQKRGDDDSWLTLDELLS